MSSATPLPRTTGTRMLADMLLALAGVMQQLRLGTEGHPALAASLAGLERHLEGLLLERSSLSIEIGGVQLLVEGMETNASFEPLRDLAIQFREAGVGGLTILPGITALELQRVLSSIARPDPNVAWPATPHISLRALRPSGQHIADPWLALERRAFEDNRPRATRDPAEIAVGLELHPASIQFDARMVELLAQIALRAVGDADEAATLDALVLILDAGTLRRLLGPAGPTRAAREFLLAAAPLLSPATLLRLCQALATGRAGTISVGALRVLAKLSDGAAPGSRSSRLVAEEFHRLVTQAYEQDTPHSPTRLAPEPDRVLKLALESGILEPGAELAADRMIARRQVGGLLALLDTVPREDPVARALRARLHHPRAVRVLLEATPPDLEALDRLIPAAGLDAAPVLLDALAESREKRVRLRLIDLLGRYDQSIAPLLLERMEGMPWYVQRNLLTLLGRLPDLPVDFSAEPLLQHRDPRVKHEAIVLALGDPGLRDRAIADALNSGYEPSERLALAALASGCPVELYPRVYTRVADPETSPELRALAISAVATVKDPVVLRLLRRMVIARGIPGLGRLAPRSPPMLAALRGLATHWANHPKVGPLLESARQSRDPEIREAARPHRRSTRMSQA
ncbi:MAG TPA: hypothetical protein VLD58_10200 [Gemmatimonadales bacterium]|nr:hypothetical protein [Gemmatimonadales bacterium]